MEEKNLDCIVVPRDTWASAQADARYITQCGAGDTGVACVFPLEGDVTAVLADAGGWRHAQNWVTDVREGRAGYVQPLVDRLREVRLRHGRVGVVGLEANGAPSAGTAPWGLVRALRDAVPTARWVDFTLPLQAIRAVKSEVEIALLARGAKLVDRVCDRIVEVARPGARDYEVWAAAVGEACRGGSELPLAIRWGSGLRPGVFPLSSHGELQRGSIGVADVEAVYVGYRARGIEVVAIEECDPIIKDLYGLEAEYWQCCLETVRVGRALGEVARECRDLASRLTRAPGRYEHLEGQLALEGQGLGSDMPVLTHTHGGEAALAAPLAAGWAFLFRPSLRLEIDRRVYEASWGDVVVLEAQGPRRLGRRTPGLRLGAGL
jgi:Xaa-Pro aminopeptidase